MGSSLNINSSLGVCLRYKSCLYLYTLKCFPSDTFAMSAPSLSTFKNIVKLVIKNEGFLMSMEVGAQRSFIDAIKKLIELEYDSIGAYKVTLVNLKSFEYRDKFYEFKNDHKRHIEELSVFLERFDQEIPINPYVAKHLLTKGKVKLASTFGDKNILRAMLCNEKDVITAYKRVNSRAENDNKMNRIILKALEDERKHKDWIQVELEK